MVKIGTCGVCSDKRCTLGPSISASQSTAKMLARVEEHRTSGQNVAVCEHGVFKLPVRAFKLRDVQLRALLAVSWKS